MTLPSYENAIRQSSNTVPRTSAQNTQNSQTRGSESISALAGRNNPHTSSCATSSSVSRPINALSALTAALQSPLPDRRGAPTTRETSRRGNNSDRHNRERNNRNGSNTRVSHVDEIRERSHHIYRQYHGRNHNQRIVTTNPGNFSLRLWSAYYF